MINKEKAEIITKNKLLEVSEDGHAVRNFVRTHNKISFEYGVSSYFEVEYVDLHENDICECWHRKFTKDRALFYFAEHIRNEPHFKDSIESDTRLTFDNYRVVERAK